MLAMSLTHSDKSFRDAALEVWADSARGTDAVMDGAVRMLKATSLFV